MTGGVRQCYEAMEESGFRPDRHTVVHLVMRSDSWAAYLAVGVFNLTQGRTDRARAQLARAEALSRTTRTSPTCSARSRSHRCAWATLRRPSRGSAHALPCAARPGTSLSSRGSSSTAEPYRVSSRGPPRGRTMAPPRRTGPEAGTGTDRTTLVPMDPDEERQGPPSPRSGRIRKKRDQGYEAARHARKHHFKELGP